MADEYYTDEESKKLDLEKYQQEQAAKQVAASQGQPNAIPAESVAAVNRVAPSSVGNSNSPQGYFIDRGGANLGTTGRNAPAGAVGIQGVLSPQEQSFWAAHPNGAVMDSETGALVGLGDHPISYSGQPTVVNSGMGPPAGIFQAPTQSPVVTHADLYNPRIQAQMNNLDQQISARMEALRTASNQRASNQPSQHDVISDELKQLQFSRGVLGREFNQNADMAAQTLHQNAVENEKLRVSQDVNGFYNGYGNIKTARGTDQYRAVVLELRKQFPGIMDYEPGASFVNGIAGKHDREAEFAERAKAQGLVREVTGYGQKGPSVKYVDPVVHQTQQLDAINKSLKARGIPLTAADLFNPSGEGHKATDDANKNKSYDQLAPTDQIAIPRVDAKGKVTTINLPKAKLEALKTEFNDKYKAAGGEYSTQAPAQPSATPDDPRVLLAQKALADPNASEIHKAAAKRILGVQ